MDDKNTQVLNTEEEFIDSHEDNESMSMLLNSVKAGGETLQTFTDKKLSETVKYTGTTPVYPVASEASDWQFDGWVKTGTTSPIYEPSANIPLYEDTSGVNTFIAHYKDVSDFIISKSKMTKTSKYNYKIQDDTIVNATNISLYGLFNWNKWYAGNNQFTLFTNKIIMRNYRGWNLDNDPVAEGKTQEEEEGIYGGFICIQNSAIDYIKCVTHLEVDIPNFKGRIHKPDTNSYVRSAGIWVNCSTGSLQPTYEVARITNYAGQTLDCLSWKEGQQGDCGNLYVDPQCAKLIAYMPHLYGCIKNGPEEIYYYKLKEDKKYTPRFTNYFVAHFPYTCKLWDAGHLNEITTHYQIRTTSSNLQTLILHYGDGDPDFPGETGIVTYGITDSTCDIPSTCKVYVPSSLISAYEADPNWSATGVEFLAIENCDPIEGHPEKDWIRKDMEACLWRFEAYNKLETIKEKRLFLKSCAGKSNDYSIPDEYKFDYPDWYWDIDDIDEGEITYGGVNTSSRTKNVTSDYIHKYITNTLDLTDLNTILTEKIDMLGAGFLYQYNYNNNVLTTLTSFTIPSNITKIYQEIFYMDKLPNLNKIVIEPDQLQIYTSTSSSDTYTPFYSEDADRIFSVYYKSLEQFYSIPYTSLFSTQHYVTSSFTGGIEIYINNSQLTNVTLTNEFNNISFAYGITSLTINVNDFNCACICPINNITFSSSVTKIPSNAFSYARITSITLPNNITEIGERAFYYSKLSYINLSNVATIPQEAFYKSPIETLVLGEGLTTIGSSAFSYAISDNGFVFTAPSTLTNIGTSAFRNSRVTNVNLSACTGLTTLPTSTFDACSKLTNVTFNSGLTTINNNCFRKCNLTSIVLPSSITTIGNAAFMENLALQDIYFNSEELTIENQAFSKSEVKLKLHFPSLSSFLNVNYTGSQTYDDRYRYLVNEVYINDERLLDVSFPDGMTTTKPYTFSGLHIKSIADWNDITQLGPNTFYQANIDDEIIIPPHVIGSTESSNFVSTVSTHKITFSEGKTICYAGTETYPKFMIYARKLSTDIKTLELPSTITEIQDYFIKTQSSAGGKIHIKIKATTPPAITEKSFQFTYVSQDSLKILVPSASLDDYKTADIWKNYASYMEGF